MPRRRPFAPRRDRAAAVKAVRDARASGLTLREAAKAAGVHVAAVCRWQALDPKLYRMLAVAADLGWRSRHPWRGPRPAVRWRGDCPLCGAAVEVRKAWGWLRFWRCERWPQCSWASWRPRAPGDCPGCGSPRFWSHSRKSIGCPGCGGRVRICPH